MGFVCAGSRVGLCVQGPGHPQAPMLFPSLGSPFPPPLVAQPGRRWQLNMPVPVVLGAWHCLPALGHPAGLQGLQLPQVSVADQGWHLPAVPSLVTITAAKTCCFVSICVDQICKQRPLINCMSSSGSSWLRAASVDPKHDPAVFAK